MLRRENRREAHASRSKSISRGFTLVEMLIAVAVIGVAVTVFMSFYTASIDLARTASNRSVAANLAEERLASIVSAPESYKWELPAEPNEEPFAIQLTGEDPKAGNPVSKPAAMPADPASYRTQEALYENFRWEAFGKSVPGGAYYEVTVVVRYSERGRAQLITLSSAVAAVSVPGATDVKPAGAGT